QLHAAVHADQHRTRRAPHASRPQMERTCDVALGCVCLRGGLRQRAHLAGCPEVAVSRGAYMYLERDEVHHEWHHLGRLASARSSNRAARPPCRPTGSTCAARRSLTRPLSRSSEQLVPIGAVSRREQLAFHFRAIPVIDDRGILEITPDGTTVLSRVQ